MKVKAIMTASVARAPLDASPAMVAAVPGEHRISRVPVIDASGMVVGLVSEYDLLACSGTTAGAVMSTAVSA